MLKNRMSVLPELRAAFFVDWKQSDAIERRANGAVGNENMRVFALEDPSLKQGCRKFVTTDVTAFINWYRYDCTADKRHFYEIILENTPCRPYFDLEFYREENPQIGNPVLMVSQFIQMVCEMFKKLFKVHLDPERNFLILDSSNDEKFSAHVIVHLPGGQLFPNNVALKRLVQAICSQLQKRRICCLNAAPHRNDLQNQQAASFLCDQQVYTKNRNFRLFLSSKCGKVTPLELASYCNFYPNSQPDDGQVLLDSIVIPKDYHKFAVLDISKLVPPTPTIQPFLSSAAAVATTSSGLVSLCGDNSSNRKDSARQNGQQLQQFGTGTGNNTTTTELLGGSSSTASPFPQLDAFMLKVFRLQKPDTLIRVWKFIRVDSLFPPSPPKSASCGTSGGDVLPPLSTTAFAMQYQLANQRFCYNRGREHKSQNVYWMVDLHGFCFTQRCFDRADCPNYVSPAFALPPDVCSEIAVKTVPLLRSLKIPTELYRTREDALKRQQFLLRQAAKLSRPRTSAATMTGTTSADTENSTNLSSFTASCLPPVQTQVVDEAAAERELTEKSSRPQLQEAPPKAATGNKRAAAAATAESATGNKRAAAAATAESATGNKRAAAAATAESATTLPAAEQQAPPQQQTSAERDGGQSPEGAAEKEDKENRRQQQLQQKSTDDPAVNDDDDAVASAAAVADHADAERQQQQEAPSPHENKKRGRRNIAVDSVEEENEDAETSVGDAEMPTGDAETPVENVETRAVDAEMTVEKDWFWDGIGIAGEEEGDAERNVDHQSQAEKQPNNGGKGVETNVDKGPAAAGCGGRSTAADGRGLLKNAETAADEGGGGPTCCWKRPKLMVSTTFAAVGKGPASMETPPGHSAATSALTSSTFRQQQQRELVPPSSSSASVTALVASSSAPATANANEAEEERAARRVAIENTIVDDFNELSCAELMDILLDDCFDDEDEDQLQQNAVESDGEHEDDQQPGERHH